MYYLHCMKGSNESKSGRRRAPCPEEAAFLDLLRTCDLLSRGPGQVLKTEDLSATQYNVLRILRGAPEGLPCGEIGSRMITRDPDITRLLDRLEKRELISRSRETKDRRLVWLASPRKGSNFWPGSMRQCNSPIASNWGTWDGSGFGRSLNCCTRAVPR